MKQRHRRVPVPSAASLGVREGRLRDVPRLTAWSWHMLPRNPAYVWLIVTVAVLSCAGVLLLGHPLWIAIAILPIVAVLTALAITAASGLAWACLAIGRHTVIYMSADAALSLSAGLDRQGHPRWQVFEHLAREPRGYGRALRDQIAPGICAAADQAGVPITATAIDRRVLGIYLETLSAFEVERWKGRRVIRHPRSSAGVGQTPAGDHSAS
jgi:hypothetical protein